MILRDENFGDSLFSEFDCKRNLRELESAIKSVLFCRRSSGLPVRGEGPDVISYEQANAGIIFLCKKENFVRVIIKAQLSDSAWFGDVIAAMRHIKGMREIEVPQPTISKANRYDLKMELSQQLVRLGIRNNHPETLLDFADALVLAGFAIVPSKVRKQIEDCVYYAPERLAAVMVDVILRTETRTAGCCDRECYKDIKGFRLNLSETQLTKFRQDYIVHHAGIELVGRLHVTLGACYSPQKTASIHWYVQGVTGPVVFCLVGAHGRARRSDR